MRDPRRVLWNQRQQALRQVLTAKNGGSAAELFLAQHAMLHAAVVSGVDQATFEDEIWTGLPDDAARAIPSGMEHSIAWCVWHVTRIEDMVLNGLIAGVAQVWDREGWAAQVGVSARDTGNAMQPAEILALSRALDLSALRAYRAAVGLRTREIIPALDPAEYPRKTDPTRLRGLLEDGSIDPQSGWLADYWGGLTVAGLLLMPPTRHILVHLNEAAAIKKRVI